MAYTGFLEIDVPFEDIHRSLHIATRIVARFPLPVRQRLKLGKSCAMALHVLHVVCSALESRDLFQIHFAMRIFKALPWSAHDLFLDLILVRFRD